MNLDYYSTGPEVASRELLFVGFEESLDAHIYNFPYQSEAYHYSIEHHPLQAMQWLESRVRNIETYQPPYAVFFKMQWLFEDQFAFVQQLLQHADLRYVPVIALAEPGERIDRSLLIQHGLDDCYAVPVEWNMLESRLDFLNQYKPVLLENAPKLSQEAFGIQLPPGKRLFDILGAAFGLVLSLPIWLVVMIAIRLESKGPVLYRSKRVGTGYKVFEFLKFRSMTLDAEAQLVKMQHLNQYNTVEERSDPVFVKFAHDPRTTRVGRFIRRFSIDELPQLLNVLRGDMSIVGNRPLPLYEAEMLTRNEWAARFLAPAGITGLWQVTKRGHLDMSAEERIALDVQYARNYCTLIDLLIIFKTFKAFIQKDDF